MKTQQFESFIHYFDQETKGRYTYYYRYLWEGYRKISSSGNAAHTNWNYYFKEYLRGENMPENLQVDVDEQFKKWEICNK